MDEIIKKLNNKQNLNFEESKSIFEKINELMLFREEALLLISYY